MTTPPLRARQYGDATANTLPESAAPATQAADRGKIVRAIVSASSGNLVEWYDFFAYSFTAIYFAGDMFPKGDATSQLLKTAGIFALGFLMRPIGSWLFGRIADRRGRRYSMVVSVLMMCFGSLMVACLPTFAQVGVWVDRVGAADRRQHRQVVVGVAVGRAPGQVQALLASQRAYGVRLRRAVEQVADQAAGVDAVLGLGDRAQRAGQAQAVGDDAGQLHRCRGHQPDLLARVEVLEGQRPRAVPDAVGYLVVVDLLAEADELADAAARDERQGGLACRADVVGVLRAAYAEGDLAESEHRQVAEGEQLARGQSAGEVVDRRASDQGVVDVEERRGARVGGDGALVR